MKLDELISNVKKIGTKFIIVSGGVCSSIGKGILTASIGVLLKNTNSKVLVVKWDPYLNVDPGTMSPLIHGEVFVTDDGAETDLDLGHYERILGEHLSRDSSVSSGQIFKEILDGEREGRFLGSDIQLVPHVVDAIKSRLLNFAINHKVDFVLVEIGGTVGDMEGEVFLEAIRQLRLLLGNKQMLHCHLSYVPYLAWANELKTKPTQHSVILLKKSGLIPDFLFLRTDLEIDEKINKKLSVMCGVSEDHIFQVLTRRPIFQLFLDLYCQNLHLKIQKWFGQDEIDSDLTAWKSLVHLIKKEKPKIKIGLIAKYEGSNDPYISVIEAIKSAAYHSNRDPEIITISAQSLEEEHDNLSTYKEAVEKLNMVEGFIIPGGFGHRGIEGKIKACNFARINKVPLLGICLGMQVMLIEIARLVLGYKEANSTEFDPTTLYPIINLLSEQHNINAKGATMRLGLFKCTLKPNSIAHSLYKQDFVFERHRHRYEFNNGYKNDMERVGVVFSGICPENNLVEISELKNHPFMVGCQFHPEFKSTPLRPHPLFKGLIEAIISLK